jgi:hypothetical protein
MAERKVPLFKARDIIRGAKAVAAAGFRLDRIEIGTDGRISLKVADGTSPPQAGGCPGKIEL